MNIEMTWADFSLIAPMLILLLGGLAILMVEAFAAKQIKEFVGSIALLSLVAAMIFTLYIPASPGKLFAPWLTADPTAHYLTLFFLAAGIASSALAITFFHHFKAGGSEYFFLLLSSLIGTLLISAAADFLTLFVGIETLSISLYVLCGYMKKWEISHEAAIKYFLMGSVATAFLLYGIALIYGAAGITDFDGLLAAYEGVSGSDRLLFLGGIAMISVGLAFKAALVPFHSWAPDVYNGAPTPVAAYLAVGSKAAAFAAFIRVFMIALPEFDLRWNEVMAWLAYASLIYANIGALRQYQLRSLFAYSGISHAGFMLMGLVAGGPMALSSLLFYISVYAFATFGAFAVIATIDRQSGGPSINDLRGLFAGSPWQALFFIFCILTLAGIPPTAGFFAKFALLKLAFGAGYYGLVITALLMTVLSAFYYLRLIVLTLSDAPDELKAPRRTFSATAVALTATATLVLLSLYPDSLLALLKPVQNL